MMCINRKLLIGAAILAICALGVPVAMAAPVPGGTLDPLTIPKYVTPLVIPPVMDNTGTANDYDIAVRQFQQQILPGGIWTGGGGLPATTVWSYGPAADGLPDSSLVPGGAVGVAPAPLNAGPFFTNGSQFNYPAFTVENTMDIITTVDWINDLVFNPWPGGCGDGGPLSDCNWIPYLIPGVVDQTLHWANPPGGIAGRDSRGTNQTPYNGPNPIIVHVHGAHVGPESDGYPEAWYLPDATGIPAGYATQGSLVNQYGTTTNPAARPGVAQFSYPNTQPSTTLWYHDHTLGMTRLNVYAGPAGYWLIRESGGGETGLTTGNLPGPAPVAGDDPNFDAGTRATIREIPIVIQGRSFNADGSLFYPANRAFFEGLGTGLVPGVNGNIGAGLNIPFDPGDARGPSDIAPIWNPEAFFNTMVVNGTTWPVLEVAPALYRFRLLNGCNSRFLNLAMFQTNKSGNILKSREVPFFQIGAEQSLLPQVVEIMTGYATPLTSGAPLPARNRNRTPAAHKDQALLMGLAERADVLVDFSGLPNGTRIRMINTAPDAPFGGFPDVAADPGTTGQVMEFVVNTGLLGASPTDPTPANIAAGTAATAPNMLALSQVDGVTDYPANVGGSSNLRDLALLEEESEDVCVSISPNGTITYIDLPPGTEPFDPLNPFNQCFAAGGVPFAPKAAVLGYNGSLGAPTSTLPPPANTGAVVTLWSDPIVTNPAKDTTETWELWNWSADAHPIHLHLVKFKVTGRRGVLPATPSLVPGNGVQPWEIGWKDTVIAYPGEVTSVAATFDIAGLYVWHCHIVEHEDNEMMVPYVVGTPGSDFPDPNGTIQGLF
jgi:spore coat protein A